MEVHLHDHHDSVKWGAVVLPAPCVLGGTADSVVHYCAV